MSEMIDRVARGFRDAVASDPNCQVSDCSVFESEDDLSAVRFHGELDLRVLARAAIAAMREPTEGMKYEGATYCDDSADRAEWVFTAMVDTALAEGTEAAKVVG